MVHHFLDMWAEEKITPAYRKRVKCEGKQHVEAHFPFVLDKPHGKESAYWHLEQDWGQKGYAGKPVG